MRRTFTHLFVLAAVLAGVILSAASCSASRSLAEGQFRLVKNTINIPGREFPVAEISPYLKQQPNSYFIFDFNPFRPPVIYDSTLVEKSKENIANHLRTMGYYRPVITATNTYKRSKISVTYTVSPGARIPISGIDYKIQAAGDHMDFSRAFYADTSVSPVHKGAFLSENLLEAERTRVTTKLRNAGFYDLTKSSFSFVADTLGAGSAKLDYKITSSKSMSIYHFGKVSISYPDDFRFKEKVLKRFNTIKPGETYSEATVNDTYTSLSSLRVFNGVNIETKPVDGNLVDCDIRLTPSKLKGFKINLEGSFTSTGLFGISPTVSFYHKNIFHGGEWLNLSFTGDFQMVPKKHTKATELGTSLGLSIPLSRLRMDVNASYHHQNRPEFTRNLFSATYGFSGKHSKYLYFQIFPVQLNVVHLWNMSDSFASLLSRNPFLRHSYSNHFDLGMGGSLYLVDNVAIVPKKSYFCHSLTVESSGNVLSIFNKLMPQNSEGQRTILKLPYSQFVKGELTLVKDWHFGEEGINAFVIRGVVGGAYAYGNSYYVPFDKQFYVGGANSLRAWQARTLGPGSSIQATEFIIPSQTGDLKMEFDMEWRKTLFWKIEGALFAEAGNVWSAQSINHNFYKEIAGDWGIGLRINLDFILMRVDMGMKIYDPSAKYDGNHWFGPSRWFKKDGFAVHFGVGYPF